MSDLDEISVAIGRLQAAQEAHAAATEEFRERMCDRLDAIDAKVETWTAHRNKLLGGAAVVASVFGLVTPWLAKKLGLTL